MVNARWQKQGEWQLKDGLFETRKLTRKVQIKHKKKNRPLTTSSRKEM